MTFPTRGQTPRRETLSPPTEDVRGWLRSEPEVEIEMSLLAAIATATVFALFGFPFRYYQCWFSFSRVGTALGTVVYLALAGGGGGLLGWATAAVSHARPTSNELLNGL